MSQKKLVDIEIMVRTIRAEFDRVVEPGEATSRTLGCVGAILRLSPLKTLKIVSPILHSPHEDIAF